ncbi:MAG TPA: hypothetical protein VED45_04840 [Steroidobacteraceae bacterium]|nr:hypothetical protein [Steroidobacteraceae bacterium]
MVAAAVLIALGTSDRLRAQRIALTAAQRRAQTDPLTGVLDRRFGPPIHLTCSIGVAASDTLSVWGQHPLAHADTAQYAAKRSGGNQVQLAATVLAA